MNVLTVFARMKRFLPVVLAVVVINLSGCAWTKRHTPWHHEPKPATPVPAPAAAPAPAPADTSHAHATAHAPGIVTPSNSLSATVLRVNDIGRFVVLNFPDGHMPRMDQHLFLYRAGLKMAEVKVVGPQQDTSIVADIISGDAQEGDSVRDQ